MLAELRKMVANDLQMRNLTRDEKAAYIATLNEHREQKVTSMRANNMAAARDVMVTTERVVKEVCSPVYYY
jgi:IMP cyclohydrolase